MMENYYQIPTNHSHHANAVDRYNDRNNVDGDHFYYNTWCDGNFNRNSLKYMFIILILWPIYGILYR